MSDAVSYVSEPATVGKVLLVTSIGDLDVELFSGQTPKACRNFVQLCLEGYYDGCLFHRVIKQFMAQTGDPTGTGHGGESIYGGQPFEDEFHSRLRFTRRGLLGMASNGKHANQSQFFVTLGPCEFLNKRHTLFAKVTGDTLFNIMRFEELEIENASSDGAAGAEDGADQTGRDRPYNPPRIIRTEVLMNPFPDIVPRPKALPPAAPLVEKQPKKKQKKNLALLSFGEEEGSEEASLVASQAAAAAAASAKSKASSKSSHDLLKDDTRLSRKTIDEALALDQDAPARSRTGAAAASTSSATATAASSSSSSAEDEAAASRHTRDALTKKKTPSGGAGAGAAGAEEEQFMDENAFDAHMKMQLLRKKGLLPSASSSKRPDEQKQLPSAAASAAAPAAPVSKEDATREYAQLKSSMGLGGGGGGASSIRSSAVRATSAPSVDDALLSPLEARRSKFKTRKQNTSLANREAETLAKLAAFKNAVAAAAASAPPTQPKLSVPAQSTVEIPPVPLEEDEDTDAAAGGEAGGSSAWLGHQIKFNKRPQDFDHMARDVEGLTYAVVDPRGEEGARDAGDFGKSKRHHGSSNSSNRRDDKDRHGSDKRSRAGTVGLSGGNRGMSGVHIAGGSSAAAGGVDVKYKTVAELEAEEENERVVQKHLAEAMQQRKRKHSRSRSRSRDRSPRRKSRSRSRSPKQRS